MTEFMGMIGQKRGAESMDTKWTMTPASKMPRAAARVQDMLNGTPTPPPLSLPAPKTSKVSLEIEFMTGTGAWAALLF